MTIGTVLVERLERSFGLYRDLVTGLDDSALPLRLGDLPSNTIGAQLWCVVGARESYARAIEAGVWSGFACSLKVTTQRTAILDALDRSAGLVMTAIHGVDGFDDQRHRHVLDLLEHEAAHQGQLIRYLYGLRLPIPESWKTRYALT